MFISEQRELGSTVAKYCLLLFVPFLTVSNLCEGKRKQRFNLRDDSYKWRTNEYGNGYYGERDS